MQTEDEQLILKKAKQSAAQKKYYKKNKDKKAKYFKEWRLKNKDKLSDYQKEWRLNNKEKTKELQKQWRLNNKAKRFEYDKLYYEKNKEKLNELQKEYIKNKKKVNPLFKLRHILSSRIRSSLKNKNLIKSKTTLDMLGCDLQTAKAHLEKQFTKGMNWSNQGDWHIDHIIPCASAKTEKELIKLFHYTNLQPLWAADNLSKSDKIIEKQLFLL